MPRLALAQLNTTSNSYTSYSGASGWSRPNDLSLIKRMLSQLSYGSETYGTAEDQDFTNTVCRVNLALPCLPLGATVAHPHSRNSGPHVITILGCRWLAHYISRHHLEPPIAILITQGNWCPHSESNQVLRFTKPLHRHVCFAGWLLE